MADIDAGDIDEAQGAQDQQDQGVSLPNVQRSWFRRPELQHLVCFLVTHALFAGICIGVKILKPQLVLQRAGFDPALGNSASNIAAQKAAAALTAKMDLFSAISSLLLMSSYSVLAKRFGYLPMIQAGTVGVALSIALFTAVAAMPSVSAHDLLLVPPSERFSLTTKVLLISSGIINGICGMPVYMMMSSTYILASAPVVDRTEIAGAAVAVDYIAFAVGSTGAGYLTQRTGFFFTLCAGLVSCVLASMSWWAIKQSKHAATPPPPDNSATVPAPTSFWRLINPFRCLAILIPPSRAKHPSLLPEELSRMRKRTFLLDLFLLTNWSYLLSLILFMETFVPYVSLVFHWASTEIGVYMSIMSVSAFVVLLTLVTPITRWVSSRNQHIFKVTPSNATAEDEAPLLASAQVSVADLEDLAVPLEDEERASLLDSMPLSAPVLPVATLELVWPLLTGILEAATMLAQALTTSPTLFTLAPVARALGKVGQPFLNSMEARLVPASDLAQMVAADAALTALIMVLAPPLANFIYQRTIETFPSAVMVAAAAVALAGFFVNCGIVVWVRIVNGAW
ncbi:hypothetical protein RI367_007151 [Sorochytrium milnesiophthora]